MGIKKVPEGYAMTEYEMEANKWCVNNNITITVRQVTWREKKYYVDIETGRFPNRKLIATSPEKYNYKTAQKKAAEYRVYYYNKREIKDED